MITTYKCYKNLKLLGKTSKHSGIVVTATEDFPVTSVPEDL